MSGHSPSIGTPQGLGLAEAWLHLCAAVRALRLGVREATRRARTRRHLATLDTRLLRDIGVSPSEAAEEANKPFWRA